MGSVFQDLGEKSEVGNRICKFYGTFMVYRQR